MPTITMDYFGMPGSGRTITEAKQDAGRKIVAALDGSYTPILIRWKGAMAFISRDPKSGWGYSTIWPDDMVKTDPNEAIRRYLWNSTSCEGMDETVCRVVMHLADVMRKAGEPIADSYPLFEHSIRGLNTRERLWREFSDNCKRTDRFQLRYRHAKQQGMSDVDAHNFAGMNPATRELWQGTETLYA